MGSSRSRSWPELDAKFPDQEEAKKLESNWLVEMSVGLHQKPEEEKEEDPEAEEGGEGGDKRQQQEKHAKRKTKKQKRKAKEQRAIRQKIGKKKTASAY